MKNLLRKYKEKKTALAKAVEAKRTRIFLISLIIKRLRILAPIGPSQEDKFKAIFGMF